MREPRSFCGAVLTLALACSAVNGQPIALPDAPSGVNTFSRAGIQFSQVQVSGIDPAIPATGPLNRPVGGGSWNFGIARTELTQGQWVSFLNALNDVAIPQDQPYSSAVGTILTGTYGAGPGMHFDQVGSQGRGIWQVTPEMANRPVWQIGWLGAAMYCNWLSNGQQASMAALTTGSYDLTQFDVLQPTTWTTITRAANAQFFIPTYDEWAVASYFDPNQSGPGQGGWWSHLNGRDRLSVPGAPGTGETSFLWDPTASGFPSLYDQLLPVASYTNSQSPWGLFDTSGSLPEVLDDLSGYGRMFAGTSSGPSGFPDIDAYREMIGWPGGASPLDGQLLGFRIATAVPSPATGAIFLCLLAARRTRSRTWRSNSFLSR